MHVKVCMVCIKGHMGCTGVWSASVSKGVRWGGVWCACMCEGCMVCKCVRWCIVCMCVCLWDGVYGVHECVKGVWYAYACEGVCEGCMVCMCVRWSGVHKCEKGCMWYTWWLTNRRLCKHATNTGTMPDLKEGQRTWYIVQCYWIT